MIFNANANQWLKGASTTPTRLLYTTFNWNILCAATLMGGCESWEEATATLLCTKMLCCDVGLAMGPGEGGGLSTSEEVPPLSPILVGGCGDLVGGQPLSKHGWK